jgi:hypothetical protein
LDGKNKAAKVMADMWSVARTTDDTTDLPKLIPEYQALFGNYLKDAGLPYY